jgi:uncharacterized integral membrane protein
MNKIKSLKSYTLYTLLLLVFLTSCSTDTNTTMFWNWKDVIGLSIVGLMLLTGLLLVLVEWLKDSWKKWRKKH